MQICKFLSHKIIKFLRAEKVGCEKNLQGNRLMQVLEESGPESRSNCGQALSRNGTDICQSPVKLGTFRIKQSMKCSSYNKQMIPKLRMWFHRNFKNPFQASWVDWTTWALESKMRLDKVYPTQVLTKHKRIPIRGNTII